MLTTTQNMTLPTALVGSIPRPAWYTENLHGRDFKFALGDRAYREQYIDAVGAYIHDQEAAGLDILTDGDARFDNDVGGRGWFFYVIDRLGGFAGRVDALDTWTDRYQPGHILYEIMEAYQARVLTEKVTLDRPLDYAAIWQVGQRLTDKPLKFGAISVDSVFHMIDNRFYESDRDLLFDLADIVNQEYRRLAAAGCPIIQIEEPMLHFETSANLSRELLVEVFNRQIDGVEAEVWAHTCWGNPAQQSTREHRTYAPSLEAYFSLDADVITFECASTGGDDLEAIGRIKSDKRVGIGVITHLKTQVEEPEEVAAIIRKALKHIPPERLVITTDCGFGREGLSRRIAYYKMVALVQGANIVRRELGLPTATIRAADPRFAFHQAG